MTRQCPSCQSEEKDKLFESIDIKQSKERFDIVKCCDCGFIYTDSIPDFNQIGKYYSKSYYSYNQKFETPKNITWNGKRYLDIGCGSGWHIAHKMKEGFDVYGIEVDPDVVKQCCQKGLKVKQSVNGKIDYESNYFDIIHLNHVLEHLHDLSSMINEIYRCLKPGGTLIISVPNIESYDAKIYGKYWRHLDVPRHLYHFSKDSLSDLLLKYHFKDLKISTNQKEITLPYVKGLYTTFKTIAFDRNIFYACRIMIQNIVRYIIHTNKECDGMNLNVVAKK